MVKILTKFEGSKEEYFGDHRQGLSLTFWKFISQEKDNGVPKYEILIMASDPAHPVIEEVKKSSVLSYDSKEYKEKYCWEISFEESKDLLKPDGKGGVKNEDKNKRLFFGGQPPQHASNNIKIVNKFYESKLEELKKLNNLIPGEEDKWKTFISTFRSNLNGLTNEDASKYQAGKKFIDELETELNKKTGKGNDNNHRERERERAKSVSDPTTTETDCGFRSHC